MEAIRRHRLVSSRRDGSLVAVTGLETGLLSGRFVFEVENAPGALNQTGLLLRCFTRGCECEALGTVSIREQWANSQQTGGEFLAILKQVKIPVKIRPCARN